MLTERSDWGLELQRKRNEFPTAVGWRAHSCVFSHLLAQQLANMGYLYVSTHDEFGRSRLRPHRHAWGVWHLPIYYMDNLDFSATKFWPDWDQEPFGSGLIERAIEVPGMYVFDFHPVHLLMNTPHADYYLEQRDRFLEGVPVEKLCYSGYGTRGFFKDLVGAMTRARVDSWRMRDALTHFEGLEEYCEQ